MPVPAGKEQPKVFGTSNTILRTPTRHQSASTHFSFHPSQKNADGLAEASELWHDLLRVSETDWSAASTHTVV